jgi:hypothetical protein
MPPASRLIYRPLPKEQEGLNGFLLRLAEGNGLRTNQLIKVTPGGDEFLPSLAALLDVQPEHTSLTTIQLRMERFVKSNRFIWSPRSSRYCPACLKESPIWNLLWEAKLITACERHQVRLVDTCTACGNRLSWAREKLQYCGCGVAFNTAKQEQSSPEEALLSHWMKAKLYGTGTTPDHIAPLSIHQLHHLVSFLGAYDVLDKSQRKPRSDNLNKVSAASVVGLSAMKALADWPNSFDQYLDRLVSRNRPCDQAGRLNDYFGRFYNNFFDAFQDKQFEPYINAFGKYVESNWRVSFTARNSEIPEPVRERHPWVSACVLAKSINASKAVLMELYNENKISGHMVLTESGRRIFYVNRQEQPLIEAILKDRVDLRTACKTLGITKRRFMEIATHPLLAESRRPVNGGEPWVISKSSLKSIIDLGGAGPLIEEGAASEHVSLAFALRYLFCRPELGQLLTAMQKQEIKATGIATNQVGIGAWMFNREELTAWLNSEEGNILRSVTEAAQLLGIKEQIAYQLVRRSILESSVSPVTGYIKIEVAAIERFKGRFIFTNEIAARLAGVDAKAIYRLLSTAGVRPCSGPMIDGLRTYIYERTAALDSAIQKLQQERRPLP